MARRSTSRNDLGDYAYFIEVCSVAELRGFLLYNEAHRREPIASGSPWPEVSRQRRIELLQAEIVRRKIG